MQKLLKHILPPIDDSIISSVVFHSTNMRHFLLFATFLFISACSHFNTHKAPVETQANSLNHEKTSTVAVERHTTSGKNKEANLDTAENQIVSTQITSPTPLALPSDDGFAEEQAPTAPPYLRNGFSDQRPQAISTPLITNLVDEQPQDIFSSLQLNNRLIDSASPQGTEHNQSTINSRNFEAYGFITPTEELEAKVNQELHQLREETPPLNGHKNLIDVIRSGFKLDLTLDNKRIQSQLKWYVNNPNYLDRTFKRSARYLHHVVHEVEERQLPMELALLPFVESAYDPFAYSHGRASGLWQFIPGTGKIYGMHQNWWYDGRRDVLTSTKGALDYLTYLNKRFDGNWLHALASYNSGSGRVSKAIKRNKKKGKAHDFWSLKLPRETRAYVPKLLALAKVVANPEKYNIELPAIADTPYFEVVNTQGQIDLAQAASLAGVDIEEIYKLNPGFNQWASAPMGPHRLLVPIESAERFKAALVELPPEKRLNWTRYKIKSGDSLIRIAKKFNTTPALIKQVNQLSSNKIRANQKLLIPVAAQNKGYYNLSQHNRLKRKQEKLSGSNGSTKLIHTVRPGDTMWDLSMAHKVGVRSLAKWNGMAPTDPIKPGQELVIWSRKDLNTTKQAAPSFRDKRKMIRKIGYRVRKGDSLARIASKFSVTVKQLVSWNKLNKKKYLQPGQKLTIYVDITNT